MNVANKSVVFALLIAFPALSFAQQKADTAGNRVKKWFPKYDFNPAMLLTATTFLFRKVTMR